MALIGWHTQVASRSRPEKGPCPAGYAPRRMARSYSGVHDALAGTGDDITADVGQADLYECREPQAHFFAASRDLVWRTVRILKAHARNWIRRGGKR